MSLLCDVELSLGVVTVLMPKLFRKVTKIILWDQCVRFSLDEADDDNIPTFFDLLNSEKRG